MRLTKISTRTGDDGSTGLADGTRTGKDHARIAVLGSIDELNSHLGVLLAEALPVDIRKVLLKIQNDLFDLGGALAQAGQGNFAASKITWLDDQITRYNGELPPLREFILPGGSRAAALCHVARAVARRAEHFLAVLSRQETATKQALPYLNRLSDLLFILARCVNRSQKVVEPFWRPEQ